MVWLLKPEHIGAFIGGVGLFLLGMRMMTEGLKATAGKALRHLLKEWTGTPLRGFLSGILITSLVQSSSAVTIAVIGFVNAGLLGILKTVYVIYGTNIGTTMTSWLVALVGFKIQMQGLALPLIGVGMLLRVVGNERRGALGEALAGFGLFFLGIAVLKDVFAGLDGGVIPDSGADGEIDLLLFTALGFLLTFMTQSSSAALAIALAAAAGGLLPITAAAATVIGANLGTTSTAALAVIGATTNAQRIAAIHVLFNLVTGMVALIIMVPLLDLIELLRTLLNLSDSLITSLALFHTLFNVLGVLLFWPFTPTLVKWLKRRLRSTEEDAGRPVYLDKNVVETPALAFNAMVMELARMGEISSKMLCDACSSERHRSVQLHKEMRVMERLTDAINRFGVRLQKGDLPDELSENLPLVLRTTRYYTEAARVAVEMSSEQEFMPFLQDTELQKSDDHFRSECVKLLQLSNPLSEQFSPTAAATTMEKLEHHYELLKVQLLSAGARATLQLRPMVAQLDLLRGVRRALQQTVKGGEYLYGLREAAKSFNRDELDEAGVDKNGRCTAR